MPYEHAVTIRLGASMTGLTLNARLRDANAGDLIAGQQDIATAFTELGQGQYLWSYDQLPEALDVVAEFYEAGQSELLAVSTKINPWMAGAAVDGVPVATLMEILLSYIGGTSALADNGNGTKTITYRKQDGVTDRLSMTFDADGQWLNTNLHT